MQRSRETDDHDYIQVIVDDHEDTQVDVDDDDIEAMRNYLMQAMQNGTRSNAAVDAIIEEPESEPMATMPIATSVADDSVLPDQQPLKTRFPVIKYKGCRIYWGGERTYRVLYNLKSTTRNFHWKTDEDAAEVWCNVIGFCIEHAH